MSRTIRPRVPGATVVFTVALADRTSDALTKHVNAQCEAVRATRTERPFHIDARGSSSSTIFTLSGPVGWVSNPPFPPAGPRMVGQKPTLRTHLPNKRSQNP
jgi:hypothetical protein